MFLTNVLLKKAKTKISMVVLRSTGSTHQIRSFREKTAEKKELIFYDPYIQMRCVYREVKRIRTMKHPMTIKPDKFEKFYGIIPKSLLENTKDK